MSPLFWGESESIWTFNRKFFDVWSDDLELKKELRTKYTEVDFDTSPIGRENISMG